MGKPNNDINPNKNTSIANFTVENTDYINVYFNEIFEVFVPNSFTPANNDNLHNTFNVSVYSIEGVEYEFEVFNRFGESIFYSNDENVAWDGSNKNGEQVTSGVYIYTLLLNQT